MKPELSKQELYRERDRLRLLLEINNAVTSKLDLQDLLLAVATSLREVIPHDLTGLAIYDGKTLEMKVDALASSFSPDQVFETGQFLPLDRNPVGIAVATRKPVIRNRIDHTTYSAPKFQEFCNVMGLNSGVSVPLLLHDRAVGAITVSSVRESAFTETDIDLLKEIAGQLAIAVENAVNFRAAQRAVERKQLLLEVNNAVATNLDLHELLASISTALRDCVPHDFTGLAVYDEKVGKLRIQRVEATDTEGLLTEGELIPMEGTTAGLAFSTRQTVRRERIDLTEFHAPVFKNMIDLLKIQSALVVPLILQDRALGVVSLTSKREAAFSKEDAELLEQISGQLAIAVDNSINFEKAQWERDRRQLLLEVNNAVVSNLSLHDLLVSVSGWLRKFIKHDFASVVLLDGESGQLRIHALDKPVPGGFAREGGLLPIDGTPAGLAITTGTTVRRDNLDFEEFYHPMVRLGYAAGLRSGMSVCLISRNKIYGSINVGSLKEASFNQEDQELLEEIAAQVALAVENALNFEEATRERARAETLLEINNAITTHLELPQLVRAISDCLRNYFKNDVTGMTLYDAKTEQWKLHALESGVGGDEFLEAGIPTSLDSPAGKAITSRKPVIIKKLDLAEYPGVLMERAIAAGFRSSCNVPLIAHDRVLGAVVLVSREEAAFNEADAEMLSHIAKQLAIAVANALHYREVELLKNKLASEKLYLEEEIQSQYNFEEIIGQSVALKKILQQVATVAPTDSAVLLCGETGTGKELIARAIHNLSGRKERTLVKLNCAAIPTGLLESELFGHEKGAFTGAIAQRVGRFELANKGTLLLDEIGEIPLDLQPKLLRVLQEHEFERLGSSRTIKTDARLIAATNVNLPDMVAEKKFRSDLFYRLNVFPITIPPLRDRAGDIPLLVGYFAQKHSLRMNKRIDIIPKETVDALCEYSWPGNVRELENFMERSVILSSGSELKAPLSELKMPGSQPTVAVSSEPPSSSSTPLSLEENERRHILEVLEQTKGVIGGRGGAAEILGLPISTLRNRMKKLSLK